LNIAPLRCAACRSCSISARSHFGTRFRVKPKGGLGLRETPARPPAPPLAKTTILVQVVAALPTERRGSHGGRGSREIGAACARKQVLVRSQPGDLELAEDVLHNALWRTQLAGLVLTSHAIRGLWKGGTKQKLASARRRAAEGSGSLGEPHGPAGLRA
jgi:hypothetical protein